MPWRNLKSAGPKCRVNEEIANDRNLPANNGKSNSPSDRALVAFVLRMDSHCRVAQHGLRTGRCHREALGWRIGKRVANMPQVPLNFLMNHFDVGQRRLAAWAPVDQPLGAIQQSFFPQADKGFPDSQ